MPTHKQSFLLKILSGAHQGSEVSLEKESLLIGTSDDCDIVLSDSGVSPKHISIDVKPEGYVLVPQENAKTYVNGKLLKGTLSPKPFQYILVGSTLFSIGPENETWPMLSASDAPQIEKTDNSEQKKADDDKKIAENDQSDKKEDESNKKEDKNIDSETNSNKEDKKETLKTSEGESESTEKSSDKTKNEKETKPEEGSIESLYFEEKQETEEEKNSVIEKKSYLSLKIAGIFTITIIAIIAIFTIFMVEKPVEPEQKIDYLETANNIIKKSEFKDSLQATRVGAFVYVSGYVKQNQDKRTVSNMFDQYKDRITVKIVTEEKLFQSIQDILKRMQVNLTVASVEPLGSFEITGYIPQNHQIETIKSQIERELPKIKTLSFNVMTSQKAFDQASAILREYKLSHLISIFTNSTGLLLKGAIDQTMSKDWENVQSKISNSLSNACSLNYQVITIPSKKLKKKFFDPEIESITINKDGISYIDLKNGKRYFVNSLLPSGYKIVNIDNTTITISKENEQQTVNISEL